MAENRALIPDPAKMYAQTETLRDVKDLSKNLMSEDFERQYTTEKVGRRRHGCIFLGVSVGALAIWLLVLTVMREIQLTRLREEVDELSANMIAISANVKSLTQKLENNRLFNEFKALEDTIYADDDQDSNLVDESKDTSKEKQFESLEKLHGLTVLEDESQLDDDDMYSDDDDAESGDWYPEYDRRREKIGTTNMVRLKPEDFTDSVAVVKPELASNIKEIKRLLNENPEIPESALPSLTGTTASPQDKREKRSVFPESNSEMISDFSAPKIMSKMDERRKTKKFTPSNDPLSKMSLHAVSRTARNSSDEAGQRRPFIAAHFHGNTSHLSTEIHEHFKGNGLVRVAHDAPHDVWYPAPWTIASPHARPTLTRNGHIHVHHTGVYLVYVQIYYLDSHDVISWVLHRTNALMDGRDTLLQCAQSSHSDQPMQKPNSCFSAAALFLRAGDRLAVRNTGGDRHSLMQPEKSFIGLVKLADAEEPYDEF